MKKQLLILTIMLITIFLVGGSSLAMTKTELGTINIRAMNNLVPGGTTVCSWDWGNLTGKVSITLWQGNQLIATFSGAYPIGVQGKGSITFKVPANLAPNTYELRVKSLTDPRVEARRVVNVVKG